jgi:hypothetical protein
MRSECSQLRVPKDPQSMMAMHSGNFVWHLSPQKLAKWKRASVGCVCFQNGCVRSYISCCSWCSFERKICCSNRDISTQLDIISPYTRIYLIIVLSKIVSFNMWSSYLGGYSSFFRSCGSSFWETTRRTNLLLALWEMLAQWNRNPCYLSLSSLQ